MNRRTPLFRRLSLRYQLIAAFLIVGLVGMGLLAPLYIRTTRQALISEANQTLHAAASRTASSLDSFIQSNLETIRVEASMPSIVAYMELPPEERIDSQEEAIAAKALANLNNKDRFYITSYALLDADGINLLDSNIPDIGIDESQTLYFQEALRNGLPYMSAVEFAPKVGGVYFYFSNPVRNEVGQIVGVLRSRYSVAVLQKLVAESRGLAGTESFAILLDENGLRLAEDRAPELIFKSVFSIEPTRQFELRAANRLPNLPVSEVLIEQTSFAEGLANANVQPFFAANQHTDDHVEQMAVVTLNSQPWWVVYTLPQEEFLGPINNVIQIIMIWTAVFAIFLVASAILIARWLSKPVVQLTAVTEQIAQGDLSARADVTSNDEVGQLAVAFNNMAAQLQQIMVGLEAREEALQTSNAQLETALVELQETQAQMVQQERVAAVGQLAAGIAHDFNNIMATVILYSDLLLATGAFPEKERKRITIIQQQGQRAADLTQQILDFSRKSIMQRRDFDLWQFLVEMRSLLVRTLPENIRFSMISEGNQFMVNGDMTRLQQVVINLVINARNAMSEGGNLQMVLSVTPLENDPPLPDMADSNWVRLAISDTGPGIPDQVLTHIFEPFFTTRAPLGSGLGLSQVDGIIKQHGGTISVETKVGLGTTFLIYLPALAEQDSETAVTQPNQLISGQGETILVVEDDALIRDALTHSLQSLNYCVLSAENGLVALQIYQEQRNTIDLVLSDLVMPEMGGKELLKALKQQNPALRTVVITGYPLEEQEAELQTLGVLGWCQKPVNLEELSYVVAQALHIKQ